jgi:signal transduction histidine kinase
VIVSIGVLAARRRSSLGFQIAVAALTPVVAVAVGVVWATSSMFIQAQDMTVLLIVLISAGTVGLVSAKLLGNRVADASHSVGLMARQLGEDASSSRASAAIASPGKAPGELADLAAELRISSTRLAVAQEEAAANDRARRELVAWVSHDLRTPISGIRLMAEALEDRLVDDQTVLSRYYTTIRTEADRLGGMVDDLFDLSRIQSGTIALQRASMPLDRLIADVAQAATPTAASKGVHVRVRRSGPTRSIDIDAAKIARAIRNLLDNAIRHTSPGGDVMVVLAAPNPDVVEVTVSDACGGIPDEDLGRVFEAGRGDRARTPGPTGGGLGLAIAAGIIRAHGGQIGVRNIPPGCCFTICLPCVASPSAELPFESTQPAGEPTL